MSPTDRRSGRFRMSVLALLILVAGVPACDSSESARWQDASHPDYREMADELIKDRPHILGLADFTGVVDSATAHDMSSAVTELNDALGRLAVLHQVYDTATSSVLQPRVNILSMPFQLIADRSKTVVLARLSPTQQRWFHEFLEHRTAAAGLPHDVWSFEAGPRTEPRGLRPRPIAHDTALTTRQ
ncbi:MAG: hypothetical protein WEE89_04850 [Gemmatimonadota bacterium]